MGLKRKEVLDVFRKGKCEFLYVTETKLKGNWVISWCGVNGIITAIHKIERAREGVVS